MKKVMFLAIISLLMVSATATFAQDKSTSKSTDKVVTVKPDNFQDVAPDLLGKEVEIQGMVVHVCRHGGKKMFIIGENPDVSVKITVSDKVSVFEPEMEGSTVYVKGIVEPMTNDEEEMGEEAKPEGTGGATATQEAQYHKPQYSISCLKIKEIQD